MSNKNIIKLIDTIGERGNAGLMNSLQRIKNKLSPVILEPEVEQEKIDNEKIDNEKIDNEKRVSYHITYSKEGKCWKIILAGEDKVISLRKTKKMAIEEAKKLAGNFKKSQIVIHKMDGKIQEERTFGQDPRSTKG